jgi:Bacterial type II/III secretion system short domain
MKYRCSKTATLIFCLVLSLGFLPAVSGQTAQRPSVSSQPATPPAPAALTQTQTANPTVCPATAPVAATASPEVMTIGPGAEPAVATAPAVVRNEIPMATVQATSLPSPVRAQAAQTPAPSAQPVAPPKAPDYVEEKGFKGKVFELKYRDPVTLQQVLRPLGSGFKGATISIDREFKTLSVRDFPENIAAIEEAIKRLDTPQPARPDIEFTVHVLIASTGSGSREDFPGELATVVTQLKGALKYKSYSLMTSGIHRGKEGPGSVGNSGVAESNLFTSVPTPANPIFYEYSFEAISIDASSSPSTVQVGNFHFNMRVPLNLGNNIQYQNVGFRSPVGMKPGEKVVVGSTTMGDKGLVVVVSAKLLK